MRELLNQLKALEGIGQRSSISIIKELNEAIEEAQSSGYKVAGIHQEIAKVMTIDLASFKTLLYRVRKETRTAKGKTEQLVNKKPREKTQTEEVKHIESTTEFNRATATQRSKNKLAQFGKGK